MTAAPGDQRGGIIAWFARNSVAANLFMAILFIGGLVTLGQTNSEVFPEIDPRTVTVSVPYPGATPEEVEDSITRRAEEAVMGLQGVSRVTSKASVGSGTLTIELSDFADAQDVKSDVQAAIDQLTDFPPEDAEEPEIEVTTAVSGVMRLVVAGDVGERALRLAAERIQRDLLAGGRISLVTIQGAREYEMSIEVPQTTLREYGLSIDQVARAIRAASVNLSGGTVRTAAGDILLRTDQEARTAEEFATIVILSDFEGRRVLLGDIARIVDGFEEVPLINTYNGKPALFLQIDRSGDEDAFDIAGAVKTFLADYRPPTGIELLIASDNTNVISDRVNLLTRNALMGLALVFVFLTLTLDLRLAFWTTVGIPIAFLGGFILFGQFVTINMVTLFALIMVLGIVVDDAIVVGENIYEKQTIGGSVEGAAIDGAVGVLAPVVVGVLTSMAVFAPLLNSTGTLGQILHPVPIVVLSVLLISLVEVFLILPAHLVHGGEWSVGPMKRLKHAVQEGLYAIRDRALLPVVLAAMRLPFLTLATFVAILIAFAGVFTGGHVRFVFFPVVEGDRITVTLEMPGGAPFEQTEAAMDRIVDAGYRAVGGRSSELFSSLSVTIGGRLVSGFGSAGTNTQSELASATLELTPAGERDLSAAAIERRWRQEVGQIPGIKSLIFNSAGLSGGDDISFDLSHTDDIKLNSAVDELSAALALIEGVSEIETSTEPGKRQLEFSLKPIGVAAGLTVEDLAQHIRRSYFGEEVQRIQRGSEEVKVYVRLPLSERQSLANLVALRIPLPDGSDVALRTVADVTETRSFASISRVNGQRVVTVSADIDEAITTPTDVNRLIEREILPRLLAQDRALRFSQEGQARDQAEDLSALARNLLLAVAVMYVLLASVLRSYIQPLIIVAVIPFGLVGAVLGHMALGYDVTFLSLFGVAALSGVVVNDSIVLIDYFNELEKRGETTRWQNIVTAVRRRFRPIVLTTLTTFLGLVPMIAETSLQAQFLVPMALSLGFGILFASLVILILVPACLAIGAPREPSAVR
ncbi:MAG: efflux RND transporter permease subunit [Alphaproteobacteria bacterium]